MSWISALLDFNLPLCMACVTVTQMSHLDSSHFSHASILNNKDILLKLTSSPSLLHGNFKSVQSVFGNVPRVYHVENHCKFVISQESTSSCQFIIGSLTKSAVV